jgi:hypothetical protein
MSQTPPPNYNNHKHHKHNHQQKPQSEKQAPQPTATTPPAIDQKSAARPLGHIKGKALER